MASASRPSLRRAASMTKVVPVNAVTLFGVRSDPGGVESFMRAVVCDHYGPPPDVLRLEEVEKPSPKDDEVLIKIHASTVNRLDCHTREANQRSGPAVTLLSRLVSGLRRPRQPILGSE